MLSSLALALSLIQSGPQQPKLFAHVGPYHRAVSSNPVAQKYFDQGMSLFYAFHKSTSTKFFQEVERQDPQCAMGYLGEALSYAPDINITSVDEDGNKKAIAALAKAKPLAKAGIESDLLEALEARYAVPAPADRSPLDKAYSEKMKALYAKYPNDADIAALYGDAVMILHPWDQWKKDGSMQIGTQEAMAAIQHALWLDPKHLMANHLWIHVMEAGPRAAEALPAADLLCDIAPDLGHLVHMPSHIYVRTGQWKQAIHQNKLAVDADRKFTKERGLVPTYLGYMGHNRMMLAYAGCMNGSYQSTQWAFADWNELLSPKVLKEMGPVLDSILSMPQDVEKRFGHWDKVLAFPKPADNLPVTTSAWHANRAVAFAAKGAVDKAQAELSSFMEAVKKVPADGYYGNNTPKTVLPIYEHLTRAEIAIAEGKKDEAIQHLKDGIKAEDQLRYDEPPDWLLPVRHTLGAAYLKYNQPVEAIKVYKQDLTITPDNGWSLLGIANAYKKLGETKLAQKWMREYRKVWSPDGEAVSSSCMCLPGK